MSQIRPFTPERNDTHTHTPGVASRNNKLGLASRAKEIIRKIHAYFCRTERVCKKDLVGRKERLRTKSEEEIARTYALPMRALFFPFIHSFYDPPAVPRFLSIVKSTLAGAARLFSDIL